MTYLNINNKDDKYFFAGFFNTAMDNFDTSLKELDRRINSKQNDSKAIINYAFDKTQRPVFELQNNFNILKESLTFMQRLPTYHRKQVEENKTEDDFYTFVKNILTELYTYLNNLRNYYTHYSHEEIEINKNVTDFLDYVLFNSANRIKKDRAKNEAVKESLWNNYKDFFYEFKDKHNKDTEQKNKVKNKDVKNFVINRMFDMFFYEKNDTIELRNKVKALKDDALTNSGLIQLLSLFLDKKQINLLFDNIQYVDSESELQKKIARWVYTYNSYKSIRYLFKSDYNKEALLLQMANELNKVPKELYDVLSEKDKQKFIEDINIYLKENAGNLLDDSLVTHEVVRKRYEDKFPYFALRFLDEINFPNLRFQVNVGKFNHDTRTKTFNNTEFTTERTVLEEISVFEKLSVVTEKKKEYFKKNPDLTMGWEEFPKPKYHFFGNSIGIWLQDNTLGKPIAPEKRKNDKTTKYQLAEQLGLKEQYKSPVAYLSLYELPALLHYLLVDKHTPEEVEKKIKEQIIKQKREFSQIARGDYNSLSLNKKLKRRINLLKNKDAFYKEKTEKSIIDEINIDPLNEIRKNYKKQPKNSDILSLNEKGKIATWLSKDIKRFTKKETRKNWKGYQFAEFQALLSFYDVDKNRIQDFIKNVLNLNKNTFLLFNSIEFSQPTLFDFYKQYLQSRKQYLKKLLIKSYENKDISNTVFTIFPENRYRSKKDLKTFFKDKLKEPLMLSRGIFYDNPTAYNNNKGEKKELAEWFVKSSNKQNAQEFYSYNRKYPAEYDKNNKVSKTIAINPNKGLTEQYTYYKVDKKAKKTETYKLAPEKQKQLYKNETKIRRIMRNDYYVLQMIKYFYKDNTEIKEEVLNNLTLKDFYLTKKEKEEKATKQGADRIFDESFILKKQVDINLYDGKITGKTKLKEAGKYKRLLLDNKVEKLVSYFSDKQWTIEEIMNQLSDYEYIRSKEFFKSVHKFEKMIYEKADKNNETDRLLQNCNPNFKKYIMYHFLKDKEVLYEAFDKMNISKQKFSDVKDELKDFFIITIIRNKFSHNQLISKEIFDYLNQTIPIQKDEKIGSYLNRVFNKILFNK